MEHIKLAADTVRALSLVPPINVEWVLKYFEFELIYDEDLKADALMFIKNARKRIVLNPKSSLSRERFTLAHELGHYLIPHHVEMMYKCQVNQELGHIQKPEESEANGFAAEFLVPTEHICGLISGQEISHGLIKELEEIYQISKPLSAIQAVKNYHSPAVMYQVRNGIAQMSAWSKSRFPGYLIRKSPVRQGTVIQNMRERRIFGTTGKVVGSDMWVDVPSSGNPNYYEETYYAPEYDYGIVLLTPYYDYTYDF